MPEKEPIVYVPIPERLIQEIRSAVCEQRARCTKRMLEERRRAIDILNKVSMEQSLDGEDRTYLSMSVDLIIMDSSTIEKLGKVLDIPDFHWK